MYRLFGIFIVFIGIFVGNIPIAFAKTYCGDNLKLTGERRGHYSTQSDQNVCFWACQWPKNLRKNNKEHLLDTGGHGVWKNEAKKRGLVCEKSNNNNVKTSPTLVFSNHHFASLNITQRKQLQYALRELGYYTSSVDGLYGPKTQNAARKYAKVKGIRGGYPNSVYDQLMSEVNVPSSFAIAKQRKQNNKNNRSPQPRSNSNNGGAIAKGILAIGLCSMAPNPSACLSGATGNTLNDSGQPNTTSRNDNSCTRNANCSYDEICVKQPGMTRGVCMGKPSGVRRDWSPQSCSRDTQCGVGARCDRKYKICVER